MAIELTKVQQECVDFASGDLLIKGVAGSGKSLVLLQRAFQLAKKESESAIPTRILTISYTNSLVRYTRQLLESTGIDPNAVQISTIDKLARDLYLKISNKYSVHFNDSIEQEYLIEQALQNHLRSHPKHRFHDLDLTFWAEEIRWIKELDIGSLSVYLESDRIGRGGQVRMSQADKIIAFEIFQEYCYLSKRHRKIDWEDAYAYLLDNSHLIEPSDRYNHVLVDEAQDLSFIKLKFAKSLAIESITIAADKAQKIYNTSFSWKDLGIDIQGRSSKTLQRSFRSTKQIVSLAESVIKANDLLMGDPAEYTKGVIPEREGEIPVIIQCPTDVIEKEILINLLVQNSKEDVIGVLYRTKTQLAILKRWLHSSGIDFEEIGSQDWSIIDPGVKISTLHSSKGLEFDIVIIPFFKKDIFPLLLQVEHADTDQLPEIYAHERNLLYVGMTRAKYELYITYNGEPSEILYDFNKNYYRFVDHEGMQFTLPARPEANNQTKQSRKMQNTVEQSNSKLVGPEVRNGSIMLAHLIGKKDIRTFLIDTSKYPAQESLIGKRTKERVRLAGKEYIIVQINEPE